MRIGIVSKWFSRGQPVVGRYLRSAFEELGHATFVLARPKKERGPRPGALDRDDVWDQPGVTEASAFEVPLPEYEAWIAANSIEAVFCDQNYQFAELAALRGQGIRVAGRFVWEHFSEEHVAGALDAYDLIYSMTHAEQERYRGWGIDTPFVQWGCHPELTSIVPERGGDYVRCVFPGGFIGHRKPVLDVVEAFAKTDDPRLRLLVTAQVERRLEGAVEIAEHDPRIEIRLDDAPRLTYLQRFANCDACLAISRWEGLGLPLYEAIAFGMPVITNDVPPMNEPIEHELNGLLVRSHPDGRAKSGITAYRPDVDDLAAAIERLADPGTRERLSDGAREVREQLSWSRTVEGMSALVARLEGVARVETAVEPAGHRPSDPTERAPVPFIVGVGRSGTTLLRLMLDAHPDLAIPPETHFVPELIERFEADDDPTPDEVVEIITSGRHWGDFDLDVEELLARLRTREPLDAAAATRAFFELYAEREGKPRWGDKTPIYVKHMRDIEDVIPEARFIHLIRDGRDVALSRAGRALRHAAPTPKVARRWKRRILEAREQGEDLGGYLEVRYEDLILDTEPTLRGVCEFIDLPWDERMLVYHERAGERLAEFGDLPSVGGKPSRPGEERMAAHAKTREPPDPSRLHRWKTEMSPEDRAAFERPAGDLLAELGYEISRGAAARRRLARLLGPIARLRPSRGRERIGPEAGGRVEVHEPGDDEAPVDGVPAYEGPPAPFIVGVTRSGTTLLRMMLDAHPQLTIPPETHFIPDLIEASREEHASPERLHEIVVANRRWGDFHLDAETLGERFAAIKPLNAGDAIRAFFELYAEREGKPRWGDKTPIYINRMMLIERALPEARFIHLIRDGRDAALSRAKRVLKEPTPMYKVAERWRNRIIRAREQGPRLRHYLELRYEDLVLDTEATLRRVCEYVELPFDEEMLHYHERAAERLKEMHRDLPPEPGKPLRPADHRAAAHALTSEPPDPSRLGRWRTEMSPDDRAAFEDAAGDLLSELGYELEREPVRR